MGPDPRHVWAIRIRAEIAGHARDLALFNLAIDSKVRCVKTSPSASFTDVDSQKISGMPSLVSDRRIGYYLRNVLRDAKDIAV